MILTEEEKELVQKHRDGYLGVYWCVEDFESMAKRIEGEDEESPGTPIYDRTKFQEALEFMIDNHTCDCGLTWFSVEYILGDLCKLNQEDEEGI